MVYTQTIEGTPWVYTLSADQFLAQEDIDIIGLELNLEICEINENDSVTMAYAEISQNGNWAQDGSIMREQVNLTWNTTPAFGHYMKGFRSLMFPAGLAIPLKEEGILYMHVQSAGGSAGISYLSVHCNVFYTKRS